MKRISLTLTSALLFSSTLFAELSKAEVKVIAEQYVDAISKRDYQAWQTLSYDPNRVSKQEFNALITVMKKMRIIKVDGLNVQVEITPFTISIDLFAFIDIGNTGPDRKDRWLQLLPDGKIKYDPLICEHPIPIAFRNWRVPDRCTCSRKHHDSEICPERRAQFERLKATGIPLYGYELYASPFDQRSALRKIRAWLREEGANWDSSEPKLNCPHKQFKTYKSRYT